MKKLLALVLSLVMVLACGAIASADGEVVNVMYGGGTPETLDPAHELRFDRFQHEPPRLLRPEGTQVVDGVASKAPEMAESYEISDDGLVYTFKLRGRPEVVGRLRLLCQRFREELEPRRRSGAGRRLRLPV